MLTTASDGRTGSCLSVHADGRRVTRAAQPRHPPVLHPLSCTCTPAAEQDPRQLSSDGVSV